MESCAWGGGCRRGCVRNQLDQPALGRLIIVEADFVGLLLDVNLFVVLCRLGLVGRLLVLLVHDCLHRCLLLSMYIQRLLRLRLPLEVLVEDADLSCIISTYQSAISVLGVALLADIDVYLASRGLLLAR